MGHLKVLIEASHALSAFVYRTRRVDVTRAASLRRFEDLELLDVWAHDLLKLPGKFGGILSKDPGSILTSVAPFSPRNSAIHGHFAKASSPLVTVRGMEEDWDDCLARISVGNDGLACLIECSGRHVAIVDDGGSVTLWDCTTFQRVHQLDHLERVTSICFNVRGDQVATYGSATTKLWSPETGELLHRFENLQGMNSLCLRFAENDRALLMASDRRCLLRVPLEGQNGTWALIDASLLNEVDTFHGTNLNSPSAIAISPDGSMVAAAYRRYPLTVWSISPPRLLKRVTRERMTDRSSTLLPFASKLSWHPNNEDLLGLFLDGYSFRFNVLDGTIQEQAPDPGRMPADIECSPDGLIYAIRGVRGTTKILDFQSSTLIYQLTSAGESVGAFRFSQDGRRFFHLRGNHCTVWEPNSLIRLSAADDHAVNSQSSPDESIEQSHIVSEAVLDDGAPIMLVSPSPVGNLVCYGDEDGLIELLDHETGQKLEIGRTATGMSIEHLSWASGGDHFCYSEISGRVTLVEVTASGGTWQHRRIKRFKPKVALGGIAQVLLSPDLSSLLVTSHGFTQTWSVESGTLQNTCEGTNGARWVCHPKSPGHILSFRPSNIRIYRWTDLQLVSSSDAPEADLDDVWKDGENKLSSINLDGKDVDGIEEKIELVVETHLPGHLLVIVSRRSQQRILTPRLQVFDTSTAVAVPRDRTVEQDFTCTEIPTEVAALAELPLNVLPNGRFVFIDRFSGLCTWHLRSTRGAGDINRHFYIPRDWLPDQHSRLLHVTAKGTILCPRKEALAMIDSSIASTW